MHNVVTSMQVFSNPASFDESGLLHITPHHAHTCPTCSTNMCKKAILSKVCNNAAMCSFACALPCLLTGKLMNRQGYRTITSNHALCHNKALTSCL